MRLEVRLYATFAKYSPTQRAGTPFEELLDDSASLRDLILKLAIPEAEVHLSIINGRIVHDRSHILSDGDRVALFPAVGGG